MRLSKTTLFATAIAVCMGAQAQGLKDAYEDYFSVGVAVNMGNLNTARNPKDMEIILTNYNSRERFQTGICPTPGGSMEL